MQCIEVKGSRSMKHINSLSQKPVRAEDSTAASAKIDFWSSIITAYSPVATSKETTDS